MRRRKWLAMLLAVLTATVLGGPVGAAPINCPGGQTATKTSGGWDCMNNGGNFSNAEDPKNPNKRKGDF